MKLKLLGWACACACASLTVTLPAGAQAADASRFDILEYRVEGNSLLDDQAIERALIPYMGEGRSLKDVEAARAGLERSYHDKGYLTVLVKIPEQAVNTGVVQLEVTEAPVSRLRVVGSQYHLPSNIRESLPQVAEGKVPNFEELQKSLAQVNQAADIKVSPVLKPGKAPGTVEVQLDVDDQLPLHGGVEINDRQALNTTRTRLSASARYDNLWQRGHSAGVSLQVSPENSKETRVASVNYLWPLGGESESLMMYGVVSRSEFATIYNSPGLGILGNAQIAGARYNFALKAEDGFVQSFSLGADYKNILQSTGVNGVLAADPAIRYIPLVMAYKGIWLQQDGVAPAVLDVTATSGLRGLLGNNDAAFQAKKPGINGISANFLALRASLNHSLPVDKWTLNTRADVQLSSGPLLDSESYIAGGVDTVRGYYEGERKGDQAIRFSADWLTPSFKLGDWGGPWRVQGAAFFDEAVLKTLQAAAGQQGRTSLASAGLGLRLSTPKNTSLNLDAARALQDGDVSGGGTRRGQWRIHSRLSMEF